MLFALKGCSMAYPGKLFLNFLPKQSNQDSANRKQILEPFSRARAEFIVSVRQVQTSHIIRFVEYFKMNAGKEKCK